MKYIMLELVHGNLRRKVPVIFPDAINHDDMARAAQHALGRPMREPGDNIAVSAGFVNIHVESTHGKSETLELDSRAEDAGVINAYDYLHGICDS